MILSRDGKMRCCMADNTKRKSITSIDDLTEVIDFLELYYKSIITNGLTKVNRKLRKVKVYPALSLPPYQRKVKVYDSLTLPDEQELVNVVSLPDNYYPTVFTEVKHVINHERYHRIYNRIADQLKRKIKRSGEYVELNNFEELFASIERSAITELYEEFFDLDDDEIILAIYDEVLDLSRDIVYEYRIRKAFGT